MYNTVFGIHKSEEVRSQISSYNNYIAIIMHETILRRTS